MSDPFTATLRQRFPADIGQANPRFVVEYFGPNQRRPTGRAPAREFSELERLLATDYRTALSATNYRIFERRAPIN